MRVQTSPRSAAAALVLVCASLFAVPLDARQHAADRFSPAVAEDPRVAEALAWLERNFDRQVEEWITITEIPAPSTLEAERAAYVKAQLEAEGLVDVRIDAIGNVVARRPGVGGGPTIVVAPHLDTVHPIDTDVTVRRSGDTLLAPGVFDNSAGVTTALWAIRALEAAGIETLGDIVFVGTVQEEIGFFGMRHWLDENPDVADEVVVVAGGLGPVMYGALGIYWTRYVFRGDGAHTNHSPGRPHPARALADAVQAIYGIEIPEGSGGTVYNVGMLRGGEIFNAIPEEVSFTIDLRSPDPVLLDSLDAEIERRVRRAAEAHGVAWEAEIVSRDRAGGTEDQLRDRFEHPLVQTAISVHRFLGIDIGERGAVASGSTDANEAVVRGIPAISVGRSQGGDQHTLSEWADVPSALDATRMVLLLLVSRSGLAPEGAGSDAGDGGADEYDVWIRGGSVIDGTGAPAREADVLVRDGKIVRVGPVEGVRARETVDARGLFVAPGFLDGHSHAAEGLADPGLSAARPLLAQGVTTVILNPDGGGPVDLAGQRERILEDGLAVNAFQLVPHGSVRREVMGDEARAPTAEELDRMKAWVQAGMEAGALGLSTGLFYVPGNYAETEELIELARVAARHGGVYHSHVRDEGGYSVGVLASSEELIRIAREADLPAIHTHIKAFGPREWHLSGELAERIDDARAEGLAVFADVYPYEAAGGSVAGILIPREELAGGRRALHERIEGDPAERRRLVEGIARSIELEGGAERIQFRSVSHEPGLEGRTLAEAAAERGMEPAELALDLELRGGAGFITFGMLEEDIEAFLRRPWAMVASDGGLVPKGEGVPHPRNYGTYARVLERYVVEREVLELEEAVRRMTSLYREAYPIGPRGLLAPGEAADVVVFDLSAVRERATYLDPHRLAEGMVHVLVNGELAVRDGAFTGVRAGRMLDREAVPGR
jgi:N-acyl-D-amino-acid deacylase